MPPEQRGKAAADLLAKGALTSAQIAGYVAGDETGRANPQTALARAATLLGVSGDPSLAKAVAQGLDQLVPKDGASQTDVHHLESGLKNFFENPNLSEQSKARVAAALGESSQNPVVRGAATLAYAQHLGPMSQELKKLSSVDLQGVVDGGYKYAPEPDAALKSAKEGLARKHELEGQLAAAQAVLGKMLTGPDGQKPDTNADPNKPQTALGELRNYVERYHNSDQLSPTKAVMNALFDPPSPAGVESFAKLTDAIRASNNPTDATALGFVVAAGREALVTDPAKAAQRDADFSSKALQLALAVGLGGWGGPIVGAMGITGSLTQGAFRAGLGKMSAEGLGSLLKAMNSGPTVDDRWKLLMNQTDLAFQERRDAYSGFETGIRQAQRMAE